jgi:multiple sugar transport system substrate-binding protein
VTHQLVTRSSEGNCTVAAPPPAAGRPAPRLRRTLLAGALSLAMITATACGGGGGEPAAGAEAGPVTLRFYWWGSDSRHQYTQKLIDSYEAANPGVTIEAEFSGFDDYFDRLATATAGGDAPDVMQQDTRYVAEYAERGALADLTEYMPGVIDTAQLDQPILKTGQLDGKTYAIPTGVNAFSLLANPKVFADTGVAVPDDATWTWDQMVQVSQQVSAAGGGQVFGVQDLGFNETSLEIYARQRGEALFNAEGDVGFTRQTLVDWWTTMVALRDTGGTSPPPISVESQAGGVDGSLTAQNRAALGPWWTNQLPALSSATGQEMELLRWPGESPQAGMYLKPAMFWSISERSEHPEAAAKFIDYLINSPEAAELALSDRGLPINTELREQITPKLKAADQKSAAFVEEISPSLAEPPPLPPQGAGEVQRILQQLHEQVLFDQLTVDQAADQFMSELDAATT